MSSKKKGHGNTVTPEEDSKQNVPANNSNQEI